MSQLFCRKEKKSYKGKKLKIQLEAYPRFYKVTKFVPYAQWYNNTKPKYNKKYLGLTDSRVPASSSQCPDFLYFLNFVCKFIIEYLSITNASRPLILSSSYMRWISFLLTILLNFFTPAFILLWLSYCLARIWTSLYLIPYRSRQFLVGRRLQYRPSTPITWMPQLRSKFLFEDFPFPCLRKNTDLRALAMTINFITSKSKLK